MQQHNVIDDNMPNMNLAETGKLMKGISWSM